MLCCWCLALLAFGPIRRSSGQRLYACDVVVLWRVVLADALADALAMRLASRACIRSVAMYGGQLKVN